MRGHLADYVTLLRRNPWFRRLWYGQLTSQLGDWFDTIALYVVVQRLTEAKTALAMLLVAQCLPAALVGLGAGVVVDRLPRKAVLIATDLGRAALVLCFLFVRRPDQVWILYAVSVLKFTLTAFFEPAREAVVPNVVGRDELVLANSLAGLTWSTMLMGGAALGGLVVDTLGTPTAFALDAASFLLSAGFTATVPIPEAHLVDRRPAHPWHELREGVGYLLGHRDVAVYALSKTLWSIGGGGVLLLLPLFGRDVFPVGRDGSLSMGLLYAARGVGAALGPVAAARLAGVSVTRLRRALGPGFLLMGTGYLLFGAAPDLPAAACCLVLAHVGGSTQWVFSTALLQLRVPNRLQGRVFAIELTLLTLAAALSSYLAGVAADAGWPPRTLAQILGATFLPWAVGLTLLLWPAPRHPDAPAE
jgi:predicted MFS family arabinose efflux permease